VKRLFLVLSAILIISCNKSNPFVGTWSGIDPNSNDKETVIKVRLVFEDSTCTESFIDDQDNVFNMTYTYTYSGNTATLKSDELDDYTFLATVSREGLTITDPNEEWEPFTLTK